MANFSIYLPDQLKKQLDKKAEESGESRNQIVRSAVEAYLDDNVKEIALELLQKYEEAEHSNILEFSSSIEDDSKHLELEVKRYRDKLEEAYLKKEEE